MHMHPRVTRMLRPVSAALGIVATLFASACELSSPLRGPGSSRCADAPGVGDTVMVAVTHAVLDAEERGPFDDHSARVIDSLPSRDGFVAYGLRTRLFGNEVWTMTVWRDEAALNAFVSSSTHEAAIEGGLHAVIRGQFDRFSWPANQPPPSWSVILERLKTAEMIEFRERAKTPLRGGEG